MWTNWKVKLLCCLTFFRYIAKQNIYNSMSMKCGWNVFEYFFYNTKLKYRNIIKFKCKFHKWKGKKLPIIPTQNVILKKFDTEITLWIIITKMFSISKITYQKSSKNTNTTGIGTKHTTFYGIRFLFMTE